MPRKNVRYYVLLNDSETSHGERGWVYVEVPHIVVPDGYVTLLDEHSTNQHTEVMPVKNLMELTHDQYERFQYLLESGRDVAEELETLIAMRRTAIRKLKEQRDAFVQQAVNLLDEWHNVGYELAEEAGMDTSYPFEQDFAEIVAKLTNWGYSTED